MSNEGQPVDMPLIVETLVALRPTGFWHHPDRFVITYRLHIGAGEFPKFANGIGDCFAVGRAHDFAS